MKQIILVAFLLTQAFAVFSQKYMTQNGSISFFSEAPLENIESTNNQVSSVINAENGQMAFSLLMKAFVFEKSLMQTHFNEKYVESEIYPKAVFKGQVQDFKQGMWSKTPTEVTVIGKLTIHGETQEITTNGTIHYDEKGQLVVSSSFNLALDAYKVKIPSSVKENISNTILVTITMLYEKLD